MKKEIKVYLQYPWKVSDSQYYKSIIENPPEKVMYKNVRKKEGMIVNKRALWFFNSLKNQIRNWTERLGLIIPNARLTKTNEKFDLIHCAHCLSLNKTPWVADFESWWQMWVSGRDRKKGKEIVYRRLKSKECKKIIAWTPEAKKEIENIFPGIKEKIEVVTFAWPLRKLKKKNKKNKVILFVSRYFYNKGGLHTLEVFDRITKKNKDVEAIFVSDVPNKIKEKYEKNKKIKIYGLLPYSKMVDEIFPSADIFVYPGYSDTFGFVFVDALSFGLPIVTVDGFSRKYIVDEGKTGFVIGSRKEIDRESIGKNEEVIIKELEKKTLFLLKNDKIREKMSQNCIEEVKNGKFSINRRNEKLRKIYEDALNIKKI